MPSNQAERSRWAEIIGKHQNIDINKPNFNVCIRHFSELDVREQGSKKILVKRAVPSIFACHNEEILDNNLDDNFDENMSNQCQSCESCAILQAKVTELKMELLAIKTSSDIQIQRLEQKIYRLENSKEEMSVKLKESHEQLSQEKSKNIKMEDIVSELQREQYISADDAKFLNVIILFFISFYVVHGNIAAACFVRI